MKRRDFLRQLVFLCAVIVIESMVLWQRNLRKVYVQRSGQTWERIRLYEAQRGDRIRFGDDPGTVYLCASDPWFLLPVGDWGITGMPGGDKLIAAEPIHHPLLVWAVPPICACEVTYAEPKA